MDRQEFVETESKGRIMVETREWLDLNTKTPTAAGGSEIEEAANRRLRESAYIELRRVNVSCDNSSIRLFGCVSSYYIRQLAQAMLQGLDGVKSIDNRLEVVQRRLPR
jgi:osmotically-inducible protein OsmY